MMNREQIIEFVQLKLSEQNRTCLEATDHEKVLKAQGAHAALSELLAKASDENGPRKQRARNRTTV